MIRRRRNLTLICEMDWTLTVVNGSYLQLVSADHSARAHSSPTVHIGLVKQTLRQSKVNLYNTERYAS